MPELFTALYSWVIGLKSNPQALAALAGMIVSILFGRWRETFVVGVLSFIFTPILTHNPVYPMPSEWAPGFGAAMAIWGVHGIEQRINSLDIRYIINSVIEKVRGKR